MTTTTVLTTDTAAEEVLTYLHQRRLGNHPALPLGATDTDDLLATLCRLMAGKGGADAEALEQAADNAEDAASSVEDAASRLSDVVRSLRRKFNL